MYGLGGGALSLPVTRHSKSPTSALKGYAADVLWWGIHTQERIDSNMLTRGTKMVIQVSRVDKGFATANNHKGGD